MIESIRNEFENPFILMTFFGGLIFIIVGFILYKFPPKKINNLYGYKTASSMKNQEIWDFSQKYSAKKMMQYGSILSISSSLAFIVDISPTNGKILGIAFLLGYTVLLILKVEKAIKNKFD